ncbi:MAG: hypothetical protein ACOCUT_02945 [bacterium]
MSKKKKVQLAAIIFLLIAVILLIPNTDWNQSTPVWGFVSLIIGTSGSILSISIPTSYTYYFDKTNWLKDNEGGLQLFISSKKHGLGKAPHVQTFEKNNNSFDEVGVSVKHDQKGNVIISATATFEGKVILTS